MQVRRCRSDAADYTSQGGWNRGGSADLWLVGWVADLDCFARAGAGCTQSAVMVTFKIVPDIRKGTQGADRARKGYCLLTAGVAQLVEHLICNQRVRGSNPFASSSIGSGTQSNCAVQSAQQIFPRALHKEFFQVWCFARQVFRAHGVFVFWGQPVCHTTPAQSASPGKARRSLMGKDRRLGVFAQVGEWLKPADCKSAPPCEVRRFESFPVHQ
jgi:hypothetical protein